MGQLEKYGLYVLCLVIFLILGVTIWGGGDLPPSSRRPAGTSSELNANPRSGVSPVGGAVNPGSGTTANVPNQAGDVLDLASLLRPVDPPKKVEPKPVASPVATGAGRLPDEWTPPLAKPPADAGKPPVTGPRPTYKVAAGDTFDSIAKEKLGAASLRTEIARLNPRIEASRLQIGQELQLPTAAELAALGAKGASSKNAKNAVEAAGGGAVGSGAVGNGAATKKPVATPGTYTIAKGDTLESIARRELGSVKRVEEVKRMNPDVVPTSLRIGQQIMLPKK
jgi:LysM repeat protein